MADYLKFAIDYKVDPCEDFYHFACGNWIRNTPRKKFSWIEISPAQALNEKFQEAQRKALASNERSSSRAIAQVRRFYQSCLNAEKEWKVSGTSGIKYVIGKIREFGIFPMLSEESFNEAEFNKTFDFSWLLAYFNSNRTVLHTIAPRIIQHEAMEKAVISFYPLRNLFSFLNQKFSGELERNFIEFLLRLMKYIAADIGVSFKNTNAAPHIKDVVDLMYDLHDIPIPSKEALLENVNFVNFSRFMKLSEVDRTIYQVNWTEYMLLVAPPETHNYIMADPLVAVPGIEYIERFNDALLDSKPRTVTNYVIVQYILSWIPLLEKKYRDLLQWFASTMDAAVPQERKDICFFETRKRFPVVVMSMYARSRSTKVLRPLTEEMAAAIVSALKDEIKGNKWMSTDFKKAVLEKVGKIGWSLIDDDLFHDDSSLDKNYTEYTGIANQPFLAMVERVNHILRKEEFMRLVKPSDVKKMLKKFSYVGFEINAQYRTYLNHIMVPLPFMDYPIFDETFPRSFLYGSLGDVIGHEISHSLDTNGRKFDGDGNYRRWWDDDWIKQYNEKANCYVEQYGKVKIPKFNIALNGTLSLAENTADNEGLKIAHKAYKLYLAKHDDTPNIESVHGFSADQLFFLGVALKSCRKTTEFTLYEQLTSLHAPGQYRVNQVVPNLPAFAKAFHCSPKSKMNPKERCTIW